MLNHKRGLTKKEDLEEDKTIPQEAKVASKVVSKPSLSTYEHVIPFLVYLGIKRKKRRKNKFWTTFKKCK